jgi:DNA-directed RNA polymerase subunit RPC12/RpoP
MELADMYRCIKCKKIVENIEGAIRCPFCGARVLAKIRTNTVKRVQAR